MTRRKSVVVGLSVAVLIGAEPGWGAWTTGSSSP